MCTVLEKNEAYEEAHLLIHLVAMQLTKGLSIDEAMNAIGCTAGEYENAIKVASEPAHSVLSSLHKKTF